MFLCIMTQYTKMTNKMQLCRVIYYSLAALHVSSDIFTYHQEHLNCITASGITHACRCRLVAGSDVRGLSVLWVAYTTHNTLKLVPTLPR